MTLTPMPARDGQVHFIQIGRTFSSKTLFPQIPSKSDHPLPWTPPSPGPPLPSPEPPHRTAQNFALFFPLPIHFRSIFLSREVFPWNCGHRSRPWTTQIARLGLGSFCASPGALQAAALRGPPFGGSTPSVPHSFGPATLRAPTFWAPHSSGPHPSGPHPSGSQPVGPRNWTTLSLDGIVCGWG